MLPLHRWLAGAVGVLMSTGALAQAVATRPTVDESKLPEWVKRQARSPYKVIIESSAARARTPIAASGAATLSGPKEDGTARLAKKATVAAASAPVATPAAAKADEPATAAPLPTATPEVKAPSGESPDVAAAPMSRVNLPDLSPTSAAPTSAAPTAPAALQLATATAATATAAVAASPPLAIATLPPPPPEPSPLTLLNRVEPEFPPDLVNDRLNQADVVVSFTVKADGEVVNLAVASSSDPRLNRSVLRAVRAWRYAPIDAPREHSVRFAFKTL